MVQILESLDLSVQVGACLLDLGGAVSFQLDHLHGKRVPGFQIDGPVHVPELAMSDLDTRLALGFTEQDPAGSVQPSIVPRVELRVVKLGWEVARSNRSKKLEGVLAPVDC
jgi:hypothetical protein